jgi:hypothetical protein
VLDGMQQGTAATLDVLVTEHVVIGLSSVTEPFGLTRTTPHWFGSNGAAAKVGSDGTDC